MIYFMVGAFLASVIAYLVLVDAQMAKPVGVRYNASFARVLRLLLPERMRAISLWRTCWLLHHPQTIKGKLSETGRRHEIEGHIENRNQWAGYPVSFPFRYAWEMVHCGVKYGWRRAYDKNRYEQEARAIAGEPLR